MEEERDRTAVSQLKEYMNSGENLDKKIIEKDMDT